MIKKSKLILATAMLALLFSGCGGMGPGNKPTYSDYILNDSEWTVTNPVAITFDTNSGIYTIDAQKSTGGFKKTIISSEPITISFKIKTHIYYEYDGYMQFFIDDQLIDEYTGPKGLWQNTQVDIGAGTHTFEWKRTDPTPDSWTDFAEKGEANAYVSIKEIKFSDQTDSVIAINQTPSNAVKSNMWIANGFSSEVADRDSVFSSWPQYGDALVDTHGKVVKLATFKQEDGKNASGNSSLSIKDIGVSEPSTLSFDYKCDLLNWTDENGTYHRNYLKVYLDNNQSPVFDASGNGQMWQKASINLLPGTHTVKFVCGTDDGCYAGDLTNATYLDNFTLVPDTIDSVDIYPKGLQETYENGDSIQFSAKALRSDGSVITGKDVTWSANGGSIDSNGKFTPGTSAGTFTVTATIDGHTASNQNVKVHGANYLTDPVTIGSNTFTGEITNGAGIHSNTKNITWEDPTPAYQSFTTNGFFVLKGSATNTKGISVFVRKQGPGALTKDNKYNPDYKYQTVFYIPAGDFNQRVWLRFGDGDYDVYIEEVTKTNSCEDYDGYEGAVLGWWTSEEADSCLYYNVTNKTGLNLSADDYAALTPSAYCQCDDFLVSNPFNAIMAELPAKATIGQKLQALYDWEIHNFHYDFVSFTDNQFTNKRKKQDAVHAVKYGMAVCEGYADLYTAFARLAGLKSFYQTSNDFNHAWTEVYYKGAWKMIDATWDDPSEVNSTNKFPTSEYYYYFLIDPDDASHIREGKNKSDRKPDISRTISTIQTKYPSSVN